MTEITEQHREWATVDRMRDMLGSVRRDYEITQTYSLFAGILCWTLQRIRSKDDGSALTQRFRSLRETLEKEQIDRFVRNLRAAPRPITKDSDIAFNDLSCFGQIEQTSNPPVSWKLSAALLFLYFSVGRDRTMIWDIHWNEDRLC